MSEVPIGSGDPDPSEPLIDALIEFTACIGSALEDICSYGLTVGDAYVPFLPDEDDDCDEEEEMCAQAWVRVTGVTPVATDGFDGGTCSSVLQIGLEVGVLRCFGIEEDGEAPSATQVLEGAAQAMKDMNAIFCAGMACEAFETGSAGQWNPTGPAGGQYGGVWTFTVEL